MPTHPPASSSDRQQCAAAVLMVRPASFGWNPETAASNHFQPAVPPAQGAARESARAEFDALASALAAAGVAVHAFADGSEPACPDAVFPNNWVSLHDDGTVVLYPMLAPNRRRERRLEWVLELGRRGHRVQRLLDLTHHELHGRYLEGTGSVVFDHASRIAYACRSPRTDATVLDELCGEIGYAPVLFDACDAHGAPLYHTNVMLSIGSGYALACLDAVADGERAALRDRLASSGREVLEIDRRAMAAFSANVLELRGAGGSRVLAASQRAVQGLSPALRAALERRVDHVVAAPVHTIEELGGGSVRCMLAEVFLPRAEL